VLFLSSNQVFDGTAANVAADSVPCPVSEYGHQKARAEAALRDRMLRGAPVAILRLAKGRSDDAAVAGLDAGAVRRRADPRLPRHDHGSRPDRARERRDCGIDGSRAPGLFQLTGPQDVSYTDVARHLADSSAPLRACHLR